MLAALESRKRSAVTGDAVGAFSPRCVPVSSLSGNDVAGSDVSSEGKGIALENRLLTCLLAREALHELQCEACPSRVERGLRREPPKSLPIFRTTTEAQHPSPRPKLSGWGTLARGSTGDAR